MKLDFDNLNPSVWFDHPDPNDEARIQLRILPVEELEKIRRKTTTKRVEYRRGQRFEVEKIDEEQNMKLTWDYCIVDWSGIEDINGEVECTTENKFQLMRKAPKFASWVTDCLDQLNQDEESRKESAEKN